MKKINYFFLGLMLSSQAFSLSVDFYDEQQNNPGATGIRLRINNDSNAPINDAKVRYYFHNTANMSYEVSGYYLAGANLTWKNVSDDLAYFEVSVPSIPVGFYPDFSGFSLALHYDNWSSWDKSKDYSYQATPVLAENNKIVLLSGDDVLFGTLPASVAAGSVETKFRISGVKAVDGAWIEIENNGYANASTKDLILQDAAAKTFTLSDISLEVGEKLRIAESQSACGEAAKCTILSDFAWNEVGEAALKSSSKFMSYVAWGGEGTMADAASAENVWSDPEAYLPSAYEADHVTKTFTQNAFFQIKPNANGRDISDWFSYTSEDNSAKPALAPAPVKLSANKPVYKRIAGDNTVNFSWAPVANVSEYSVIVRDANNQTVYQGTVNETSLTLNLPTGSYTWDVRSNGNYSGWVEKDGIAELNFEYFSIEDENIDMSVGRWVNIESIAARRDTKMLDLGWLNKSKEHTWDRPNPEAKYPDVHEAGRCWAIAIEALNHYYGGNLTQDEIVYHAQFLEEEPLLSPLRGLGGTVDNDDQDTPIESGEIVDVLKWALHTETLNFHAGSPSYDVVKNAIDNGKPIYVGVPNHAMVLYGYAGTPDNYAFFYMNVLDNNGGFSNSLFYDKAIDLYMIPEVQYGDVEMTDYRVHYDSDSDGITNFEEETRFFTDPFNRDSDNDGIEDKQEIYNYLLASTSITSKKDQSVYNPCYITDDNHNICSDLYAIRTQSDKNNNGNRRENDSDDNGDGRLDGLEGRGTLTAPLDVPGDYTLLGREYVRINDGVKCYNTSYESNSFCDIASDNYNKFEYTLPGEMIYPVIIGSRANVGSIFTTPTSDLHYNPTSQVFLRGSATVNGNINFIFEPVPYLHYKDDPNAVEQYVEKQNASTIKGTYSFDYFRADLASNLRLNYDLPEFLGGTDQKIIKDGETYHLKDQDKFKSLVVNRGGTLVIEPGEMYIDENLQIDAGATITWSEPGKGTVLHLNGAIKWNIFNNSNSDNHSYWVNVAKGFKLIQHSSKSMYFNGLWAGTVYAPISPIVMGQATRNIYGRLVARNITVHQYAKVYRVDFNPTDATDVAYLAK